MSKLLNLVALSSLAVLAVTFGPASTNALSTGHAHHLNRHFEHGSIAKKKRDSKRCKARPSTSSSSVKPTSTAKALVQTTTSAAPQTPASTKAASKTSSSKSSSSTGTSSGGAAHPASGKFGQTGSKICAAWGDGNDASISKFKTNHVVGYVAVHA